MEQVDCDALQLWGLRNCLRLHDSRLEDLGSDDPIGLQIIDRALDDAKEFPDPRTGHDPQRGTPRAGPGGLSSGSRWWISPEASGTVADGFGETVAGQVGSGGGEVVESLLIGLLLAVGDLTGRLIHLCQGGVYLPDPVHCLVEFVGVQQVPATTGKFVVHVQVAQGLIESAGGVVQLLDVGQPPRHPVNPCPGFPDADVAAAAGFPAEPSARADAGAGAGPNRSLVVGLSR